MKKFGCGCAVVIAAVAALVVCVAVFAPDTDESAVNRPTVGQLTADDMATEVANGNSVLAWLKQDDKLTDLQKEEQLAPFKGKNIVIKGVVEEIGKETLSFTDKIYVALKVGDVNWLEEIHIQFSVLKSAENDAKALRKGQPVVMRGRIVDNNGIETAFVKLVCDMSEVVPLEKYNEALSFQGK